MKSLLLALALLAGPTFAQPLALPKPPQAGVDQRVGAPLPLALPFLDEQGRTVTLGDLFGRGPVLLVPGYYGCPELCGLVMHGVLDASSRLRRPVPIVRISIDPRDTPADAASARARDLGYAHSLGGSVPQLHLLVGRADSAAQLARAIGYRWETTRLADAPAARFAHPATVVLATPDGRVARYFMGVAFDPDEWQEAIDSAAGNRLGAVTDRLALLCAHFDPRAGLHTRAVMDAARAVGLLTVAGLAGWCWRRRQGPRA